MYDVLHYNICQYIFVGQEKFFKKATFISYYKKIQNPIIKLENLF